MIVVDAVLGLVVVVLAWRCVSAPDLFQAVVAFIVTGLMLALAWARLGSPDLALAEAAIGAGLLGVLLLATWRVLRRVGQVDEPPGARAGRGLRVLAAVGSAAVGGLFAAALSTLELEGDGRAGTLALGRLDAAGVDQPVTAVLLNFRSYDTLMEMGVLLMALIGSMLLVRPLLHAHDDTDPGARSALMPVLVTVFTPLVVVTGGYLVWAGAHSPGGAFQGGAALAGAGVMLVLGRRLDGRERAGVLMRVLLVSGVSAFIAAALVLMPLEGAFMAYPEGFVYPIMVVVEYALAASIALSLILLFTGTHGLRRPAP